MKNGKSTALPLAAAMFLAAAGVTASAAPSYHALSGSDAGTYRIDPQHTNVLFTIGHVGIVSFTGRFDQVSGRYHLDPATAAKDWAHITIPVSSIDTNFGQRNRYLLGKEFFDAKKYPDIRFVSTRYVPHGSHAGELYGNLTLHGVTRPVVFRVRETGAGEVSYLPAPWGGYLSGFVATVSIHRSDYGLTAYLPEGLSNRVRIRVEVEGIRVGGA